MTSVEANIHSELTSEQEANSIAAPGDTTGCSYDDARRIDGVYQ